jgi:hypothetical protein
VFPRRRFPHGAAPLFPLFVPLLNRTQARADVSECPRTIPKCSNVSGDPIAFQTSMQREFFHPLLTTEQRLLHCSNQAAPHDNSTPLYILVHPAPASALRLPSAMQMHWQSHHAQVSHRFGCARPLCQRCESAINITVKPQQKLYNKAPSRPLIQQSLAVGRFLFFDATRCCGSGQTCALLLQTRA